MSVKNRFDAWVTALWLMTIFTILALMNGCGSQFYTTRAGIEVTDLVGSRYTAEDFDLAASLAEEHYGRAFEWDKLRIEIRRHNRLCMKRKIGKCRHWVVAQGSFERNAVREIHEKGVRIRHLMVLVEPDEEQEGGLEITAFAHEIEHWYLRDEGIHPKKTGEVGSEEWLESAHSPPFSYSRFHGLNARIRNNGVGR